MTLMIDFPPEIQSELQERSRRVGLPLEEYVKQIVEKLLVETAENGAGQSHSLTSEERIKLIRSIGVPSAAVMSDYATSRESLYEDHD